MRAMDIMTTNVITITPDASVQNFAALLCDHRISGVPVVDAAGALVGIVSEGDLLHRPETGTERRTQRRRARWLDSLAFEGELARDYVKSHSRVVGDIMTRKVITVTEETNLDEIANLLETKRIKRVPVVREGKVVGIISRDNLVRVLAAVKIGSATGAEPDDYTIRAKLLTELNAQEWTKVWTADIIVRDKVVHLWYSEDQPAEERQALRVAAENIPGIRGVEEHVKPAGLVPPASAAVGRSVRDRPR
jgi:CBS domain-containing protein